MAREEGVRLESPMEARRVRAVVEVLPYDDSADIILGVIEGDWQRVDRPGKVLRRRL